MLIDESPLFNVTFSCSHCCKTNTRMYNILDCSWGEANRTATKLTTFFAVNCDVQRLKRKTGIRKAEDVSEFVNNLPNTHVLVPKQNDAQIRIADPVFKSKFHSTWNEQKKQSHLFEILTAFQATLQGLCEHVLLLDRVQFLRENGLDCAVYKVADDRISPRCHALVARRR